MKQNKSPWKVHPLKCVPRGWLAPSEVVLLAKDIGARERERERCFPFFVGEL